MAIYRIYSDVDGESHIEDLNLEEHPELGALINVSEVRVQEFDGSRNMDFHPLPERRLVIHLSGEVEIGASDGSKRVLRAGGYPADGRRHRKGPHPRRPVAVGRGLRVAAGLTGLPGAFGPVPVHSSRRAASCTKSSTIMSGWYDESSVGNP